MVGINALSDDELEKVVGGFGGATKHYILGESDPVEQECESSSDDTYISCMNACDMYVLKNREACYRGCEGTKEKAMESCMALAEQ